MPRINIEEEFWGDQRVERLKSMLGRFVAEGACVCAWRLAQKYWNGECNPIPKEVWQNAGMPGQLISVGLVKECEDGFYVAGSHKHFEWYKSLKESAAERGRRGGRISAARPRDAKGRLLSKQDANAGQAPVWSCPSKTKPSSSSSSSSSVSKKLGGGGSSTPSWDLVKEELKADLITELGYSDAFFEKRWRDLMTYDRDSPYKNRRMGARNWFTGKVSQEQWSAQKTFKPETLAEGFVCE